MAKKRKRTSGRRRRRKGTMRDFPLAKRGRRKGSRRRKRRKTGLSEIVSHEGLKRAGKAGLAGAAGGAIAGAINLLLGDRPGWKFGANALGSIVLAAAFDMPNMAAGMSGAATAELTQNLGSKLLSEMEREDFADEDALDEYPDALDEEGNAMYLAEDGEFYYMEDFELADDGNYYLSETMQAQLYPGYIQNILTP